MLRLSLFQFFGCWLWLLCGQVGQAAMAQPASPLPRLEVIEGHTSDICVLAVAPDGKRLASGGRDRCVKFWNLESKELLYTWRLQTAPIAMALSTGQSTLAVLEESGAVRVFDLLGGEEKANTLNLPVNALRYVQRDFAAWDVAFSRDNSRLLACNDRELLWCDTADLGNVHRLTATDLEAESLAGAAWETNGTIAVFSGKGELFRVDAVTRNRSNIALQNKDPNNFSGLSLKLSDDGRHVALLFGEKYRQPRAAVVYDLETLAPSYQFDSTSSGASRSLQNTKMYFVPGTAQLAVSTYNETLLWDAQAKRWNTLIKRGLDGLAFSNQLQLIAYSEADGSSTSGTIKLAIVQQGASMPLRETGALDAGRFRVGRVEFASDGSTLLASAGGRTSLWSWNFKRGAQPTRLRSETALTAVTPEGKVRWVTGDFISSINGHEADKVLWSKQLSRRTQVQGFSPSGRFVIAFPLISNPAELQKEGENDVTLYDFHNGGDAKSFASSWPLRSVEVSPDDKFLATIERPRQVPSGYSGALRVWDIASGELLFTVGAEKLVVHDAKFSPNNRRLAELTASDGKSRIRLWDLETREVEQTIEDAPGEIGSLAFWPDSRTIAYSVRPSLRSVRTIFLYNLSKRQVEHAFDVPSGNLAFGSPKSGLPLLAVAGIGNSLTLWDRDGRMRLSFHALPDEGWIQTTPEGYFLASSNAEKYVRWRGPKGVLSLTQNQRNFSPERIAQAISAESTSSATKPTQPGASSTQKPKPATAASKPALPPNPKSAWAKQQLTPQAGEIALHGTIEKLFAPTKTFLVVVQSFTLPSGKTNRIASPKAKLISVRTDTIMLSDAGAIDWEKLFVGSKVTVVGKDAGSGNMLEARSVGLLK